jgi:hypothetical protein
MAWAKASDMSHLDNVWHATVGWHKLFRLPMPNCRVQDLACLTRDAWQACMWSVRMDNRQRWTTIMQADLQQSHGTSRRPHPELRPSCWRTCRKEQVRCGSANRVKGNAHASARQYGRAVHVPANLGAASHERRAGCADPCSSRTRRAMLSTSAHLCLRISICSRWHDWWRSACSWECTAARFLVAASSLH